MPDNPKHKLIGSFLKPLIERDIQTTRRSFSLENVKSWLNEAMHDCQVRFDPEDDEFIVNYLDNHARLIRILGGHSPAWERGLKRPMKSDEI